MVLYFELLIMLPSHSTVRSLLPQAGLCHKKPSKCEEPLASTLQERTVQQATQTLPAGTSGPCGCHAQTDGGKKRQRQVLKAGKNLQQCTIKK